MVVGRDPAPGEGGDWAADAVEDELGEWPVAALDQRFAQLGDDEYLVMYPSEESQVGGLPEGRRNTRWIAFRPGRIVMCDGRRQDVCSIGGEPDTSGPSAPRAVRLVLVNVQSGGRWWARGERRYVIASGADDELLGWIDHSPPSWDFRLGQLTQIATLTGLEAASERFRTEAEFSAAHPTWLG